MTKYSISTLLNQAHVQLLFDIFENDSKEICLVGGCVRDALIGRLSNDIDIAANSTPDEIIKILKNNNIRFDSFAYKYGSITAYISNQKFQITTLREDFNQSGRHTNIIFTKDWKKDAARRDFTINAMYLTRKGKLKDFFNAREDLSKSTLRFIGSIEDSIVQDYLRIFRYYRFLGLFEKPDIIKNYDDILLNHFDKALNYLSNDLIRQEILKMFKSMFPLNSFIKNNESLEKKKWIKLTKQYFFESEYKIGLSDCLNKIDLIIK